MKETRNYARVIINGKEHSALIGAKLSSVLKIDMPCAGHGKCGKCKVKAHGKLSEPTTAEIEHLNIEELNRGIRLACMTVIEGNCEVETVKTSSENKILTSGAMAEFTLNPSFSNYGVAIDIGTTTIAAAIYNTSGETLAQSCMLNPQSVYGADVVSRIEAALKGDSVELSQTIVSALDETIDELAKKSNISTCDIDGIVITGNTVMLYLMTKTSTEPLSHAPFKANELFGKTYTAKYIGLSNLKTDTPVYLPECISAFVGADIVCALISTGMYNTEKTELLADIGTNGEIALINNGKLTVSSTAAGPAFEGVGISMGMRSENGAIDRVSLKDGKIEAHIIGDTTPKGICGSGLIDAVACLLENGLLDETGYLENDPTVIAHPVKFTAKDIRMVQLAKSAICAGINTLIKETEISHNDISTLHIAGGFGSYLNMENAGRIGLIPNTLVDKVNVEGNAALSGAAMLLLNNDLREKAKTLANNAKVLELSANPVFADEYMEQMMF